MQLPVLYSFRRCPYAMRARMSIIRAKFEVELREVVLRDRPEHMMEISPKGTVPVLLLENGIVIEESLEIMQHVINWKLDDNERYWINRNDNEFKYHLDRFKYDSRYQNNNKEFHFTKAIKFIEKWNKILTKNKYFFGDKPTIADWSIWPFVRQFKIACENQRKTNYLETPIKKWLDSFENNKKFKSLMYKYELWAANSRKNYFPSN